MSCTSRTRRRRRCGTPSWRPGRTHGLEPAGLGARDTLRLEAGYCLYGHELTDDTTPLEAGLGWVVKPAAKDFVGRDALQAQKDAGVPRRLVGLVCEGRGIPRDGCPCSTRRARRSAR